MAKNIISADKIFDGFQWLSEKALVIKYGKILDIIDKNSIENVQHFEGILTPGFINCHCHTELSHMKNVIPEATGLMGFVGKIMQLRQYSEEEIKSACTSALEEMSKNGIVAVGDICNTTHSLDAKTKSNLRFQNFIELAGFLPEQATPRFENGEKIAAQFEKTGVTSIVPHAPYSVSKDLFEKINSYSQGKIISIHNEETPDENLLYEKKEGVFLDLYKKMNANIDFFQPTGKTSLHSILPYLNKPSQILLVHNSFTSESDIQFAEDQAKNNDQQIYWTLCPNANWYIERTIPPVELLRKNKVKITLGTDSIASNYSLNILSEIHRLQKHFPNIPQEEYLQWATSNGAKALGMQAQLGTFSIGKTPGINLISNDFQSIQKLY